jgi:hypothetical protein
VIGRYRGYDEDGDGGFEDWHFMYEEENLAYHIGSANEVGDGLFRIVWDTSWVPDQAPGAISLNALIRDATGTWTLAPEVTNLTLERTDRSVRLYTAENVPQRFWVRDGKIMTCDVQIPGEHDLGRASGAIMHFRSWNGRNNPEGGEDGTPFQVNGSSWMRVDGRDHRFDYRMVSIDVSLLTGELNTLAFRSETVHHGCEILWPGPALSVEYDYAIDGE